MNTLMKKRLNLEYPNSIRNRLIFISARKQHILFSRITPPGIRYWSSLDRHCSLCIILSFSAILGTKFLLHGCAALAAANLSRFSLFKFFFAFFTSHRLWMVEIMCFRCSLFPHFQSATWEGAFRFCFLCFSSDSKLPPSSAWIPCVCAVCGHVRGLNIDR